jgi:hypothetical protein
MVLEAAGEHAVKQVQVLMKPVGSLSGLASEQMLEEGFKEQCHRFVEVCVEGGASDESFG